MLIMYNNFGGGKILLTHLTLILVIAFALTIKAKGDNVLQNLKMYQLIPYDK